MNRKRNSPNRLIHEKSPYLLQHAYNPVDWYPWGEEAFRKAQKEDKPIFLSIGYSTCHWCHVMGRESFEDEDIADLLNESFVCIKVDREERPDIDSIYMSACQLITKSGGWPLTIVMTPDRKPFFAATYIPKESRFGLMGMKELLPRLHTVWTRRRGEVLNSADEIVSMLQGSGMSKGEKLDVSVLHSAYEELSRQYDERYGGFGNAPKFPMPVYILFLLRYQKRTQNRKALKMVEKTLKAMRMGGIWDHIGFGFHRYSTDQVWLVPHFEKMLYDQALLSMVYTEAFQATGDTEYKRTAGEIFEYVLRDMTSDECGFYSAEDADSEGEEGKFYLWDAHEVTPAGEDVIQVFNITKEGNFQGTVSGKNIVHLKKPLSILSEELNMSEGELCEKIEGARKLLFEIRKTRVHPAKDDKILTDWNGLMIAALSRGAHVFGEARYRNAAQKAADFILKTMTNTILYHRYRDTEVAIPGFLDDYAFFGWGLLELYETTFDTLYLKKALHLTEYMVQHFWDSEHGGFYHTSDTSESILIRQKHAHDGVIPSGNAVAFLNLLRLARITGDTALEEKASALSQTFSRSVKQLPSSYTFFLTALDFAVGPSFEVVLVGNMDATHPQEMITALRSAYIPNKVVIFRADEESPEIATISPFVSNMLRVPQLQLYPPYHRCTENAGPIE